MLAFFIIFLVGLGLTVLTFAVGELFEFFGDGPEFDTDGAAGASPFSSRIIFVFATAFGGFGMIGQALEWNVWLTVLFATGGGFMIAGGTFFLVVAPLARQQGTTRVSSSDFLNMEGQAVSEIPAQGLGRVSLIARGSGARVAQPARSATGETIPFGTAIRVVRVGANALTVRPLSENEDDPPAAAGP
jgi:membrane-bound ClpP family serine protease